MENRNSGIDVLRGVAVLLVMQLHMNWWALFGDALPLPPFLIIFLDYGWAGVDIFFVISAYLLTAGLLRQAGGSHLAIRFYARRALRILPLYWALLLAGSIGRAWWLSGGGAEGFWLWRNQQPMINYLLFLQNWVVGWDPAPQAEFYGPTWSLAVEEHFYLALPLLVFWLGPRKLGHLAGCLVLATPAMRMALVVWPGPAASYNWTFAHLDAFAWGMLVALTQKFRPDLLARVSARAWALMATVAFLGASLRAHVMGRETDWLLGVSIVSMGGACALLAAIRPAEGPRRKPGLISQALGWCGTRCYALYLFHMPVLGLTFAAGGWLNPNEAGSATAPLVALSIGLTFTLSAFAYHFVEQPFMRLANRITPYAPAPG